MLLYSWQQPRMLSFRKHTGAPPTTPEWPEASPVLEGPALDEGRQKQLCSDLWGSRDLAMALISYAEGTALCDFCFSQGARSDTCSFLLFHPYQFQEFFIPITAMPTYLHSNRQFLEQVPHYTAGDFQGPGNPCPHLRPLPLLPEPGSFYLLLPSRLISFRVHF